QPDGMKASGDALVSIAAVQLTYGFHCPAYIFRRRAGACPNDSTIVMVIWKLSRKVEEKGNVGIRRCSPRSIETETRRHDTDDCEWRPAYLELGADDIGVRAKTFPHLIRQH